MPLERKIRHCILTLSLAVISASLYGQLRGGYRFGINLTTMAVESDGLDSRPDTPVGVQFGLNFDIPAGRHFFLLSGFVFSSKGADFSIDSVKHSLAPAYVEIPVNVGFRIGSESVRGSLFAGPYLACAIGGYEITGGNEFRYLNLGRNSNDDLKYFDAGLNIGASLELKGYLLSAQYGSGFRNVSPAPGIKMMNRVWEFTLTTLR